MGSRSQSSRQPTVELFSPGQVAAACVLAVASGPATLLAANELRLGRSAGAAWMIALGVAGNALIVALALVLPGLPAVVGMLGAAAGGYVLAKRRRGDYRGRVRRAPLSSFIGYSFGAFLVTLALFYGALRVLSLG